MSTIDPFEQVAAVVTQVEDALAMDPLARGRRAGLTEMILLNMVMDTPNDLVQVLADEDGVIRRIPLEDPLRPEKGQVNLDRVEYADGSRATILDHTGPKGWGTYKINPDTGRTTRIVDGKERRAGLLSKYLLSERLKHLTIKWD